MRCALRQCFVVDCVLMQVPSHCQVGGGKVILGFEAF